MIHHEDTMDTKFISSCLRGDKPLSFLAALLWIHLLLLRRYQRIDVTRCSPVFIRGSAVFSRIMF